MPTAGNVITGKPLSGTGGVFAAPIATALPADGATPLIVAYVDLGYVGEDGLAQTIDSDTEKIRAWGGDTVKTVRTTHDVSYTATLIEWSEAVLSEVYGADRVTVVGDLTTVAITADELPRRRYVFEMADGTRRIRVVLPNGQITGIDDVEFSDAAAAGHPITIDAYPDEDGVKAYLYLEDAA